MKFSIIKKVIFIWIFIPTVLVPVCQFVTEVELALQVPWVKDIDAKEIKGDFLRIPFSEADDHLMKEYVSSPPDMIGRRNDPIYGQGCFDLSIKPNPHGSE